MRKLPSIGLDAERTVRGLGRLLVLALALVLAWRGATWIWYFAAPAPAAAAPDLRGAVSVANVAQLPWFGAAAPRAAAAEAVGDIRIIGLFAGGKRPMALLAVGNQNPTAAAVGETLAPGVQLLSIADDHVVVQRNGTREQIMLTGSTAALPGNPQGKGRPRR